jgi:hypothetical protein
LGRFLHHGSFLFGENSGQMYFSSVISTTFAGFLSKICQFFDLRKFKANPSLVISDLEFQLFSFMMGITEKNLLKLWSSQRIDIL